jgi:SAM-dependent methyltransferase
MSAVWLMPAVRATRSEPENRERHRGAANSALRNRMGRYGQVVNRYHRWFCSSDRWARRLRDEVVPWVLQGADLGTDVLEVGPGPGLTTDVLRQRVPKLTSVEVDETSARRLRERLAGTNVTVVQGDATRLAFPDGLFTGATAFTMLHHVPSPALQDRLLAEVARVLRPGGAFVGFDSTDGWRFRLNHLFDTGVPVDPEGLPDRLRAAGFDQARVHIVKGAFRFRAWCGGSGTGGQAVCDAAGHKPALDVGEGAVREAPRGGAASPVASCNAGVVARVFRIVIPVSDMAAADHFYQALLDHPIDEIAPTRHYIDGGGVIVALVDPSGHGGGFRPNPDNIYFAVDDLEGAWERARAAAAGEVDLDEPQFGGGIATRPWGERSFYCTDPFGNRLCFVDETTLYTGSR